MKKMIIAGILCVLWACGGCQTQSTPDQAQHYAQAAQKDFLTATALYEKELRAVPDSAPLHYAAGMVYYQRGDFERAINHFRKSKDYSASRKYLAISLYRSGDYTGALDICNQEPKRESELLYYEGLICEKLNLFDRALKAYRGVMRPKIIGAARQRISIIEKAINPLLIKDIDPEVAALLAHSPGQQAYPQAGALILLSDERGSLSG